MADENEDELPELDELIDEVANHTARLKQNISQGVAVDTQSELVETFLPLMLDSLRAISARLDQIDTELFPAMKISEDDALEIAETLHEARAIIAASNPALAVRMQGITDAIASELGDEDDDDEQDAPN